MEDITAIILTKNEEKNLPDCINSIKQLVKRIVVIDSYSTDRTVEIAKNMGAEVYKHTLKIIQNNIDTEWRLPIYQRNGLSDWMQMKELVLKLQKKLPLFAGKIFLKYLGLLSDLQLNLWGKN